MGRSEDAWWKEEIDEKYTFLMTLLVKFLVGTAIIKIIFLVLFPGTRKLVEQFSLIIVLLVIAFFSRYMENKSPYLKVLYSFCFTELMSIFCYKIAQVDLNEHEISFCVMSTMIMVCLQLSFIYSKILMSLIFIKFEFQWYFVKLLTGQIEPTHISSPYSAMVGALLFYLFYRTFQTKYSYELYQSKRKNSVLLNLIPAGILVVSRSKEVLFHNSNIIEVFNTTPESVLEKLSHIQINENGSVADSIVEAFGLPGNTEKNLGQIEYNREHFEWIARTIDWVDSEAVLVTCSKITEIVQLQRSQIELSVKDQLLRSVAHDLRTPSYSISSYSEMILKEASDYLTQDFVEALQIINTSSKMLLSLINDILDYSRYLQGAFSINITPCSPHKIIRECCNIVKCHILKKELEFIVRIDQGLPTIIYTDPTRLKQILLNLLSNAIKFTSEGQIEVCAYHSFDNLLQIQVKDTGRGIEPHRIDSIFSLFSTSYESAAYFDGCGIGLNIANALATELGTSSIKVTSTFGKGSCFSFSIKMNELVEQQRSSDSDEEDLSESTDAIDIKRYSYHRLDRLETSKVLIVDDEVFLLDILGGLLANLKIEYSAVASGDDAISVIRRRNVGTFPIRVVLIDLQMPGRTGIETTRELGRMLENEDIHCMPVIIGYSADHSPETLMECINAGMLTLLPKPSPADILREVLSHYLY